MSRRIHRAKFENGRLVIPFDYDKAIEALGEADVDTVLDHLLAARREISSLRLETFRLRHERRVHELAKPGYLEEYLDASETC